MTPFSKRNFEKLINPYKIKKNWIDLKSSKNHRKSKKNQKRSIRTTENQKRIKKESKKNHRKSKKNQKKHTIIKIKIKNFFKKNLINS